jgi:8-oxo-dGTP pyrophosphatase MutT (NUDIX family)
MKLLKEIKDKEFPSDESTLDIREASRAVLFDENGLVPLLFVSKHNYHKLPGGGIDDGEDRMKALVREVKEEVGAEIKVVCEVGEIIEHRSKLNLKQISYCYIGTITSKGNPAFTDEELNDGFKIVWLSLDDAISAVEHDLPDDYEGPFIQRWDWVFLETTKQILNTHQI